MRPVVNNFNEFLDFIVNEHGAKSPDFSLWSMGREWVHFETELERELERQRKATEIPDKVVANKENSEEKKCEQLKIERHSRYKPLLMIVEDEPVTQYFIENVMGPYCRLVTVGTAPEASAMYQDILPNIVFLDIQLPGGDGCDLVEEFYRTDPDAFVVMVSASLDDDAIMRCIRAGAEGFVEKPIDKERLLRFVYKYNGLREKVVRAREI